MKMVFDCFIEEKTQQQKPIYKDLFPLETNNRSLRHAKTHLKRKKKRKKKPKKKKNQMTISGKRSNYRTNNQYPKI